MILHQRLDYQAEPDLKKLLFLRIPLTSTLWTVIESSTNRSPEFPSRILESPDQNCVLLTGVDASGMLRRETIPLHEEFRVHWRIVPDKNDPQPTKNVVLPLNRNLSLTFSHGNTEFISLTSGGVDVSLNFDLATKILSSSWFSPRYNATWYLYAPKKLLGYMMNRLLPSVDPPEVRTYGCLDLLRCLSDREDVDTGSLKSHGGPGETGI
jgi:hypothetical protein